MLRRRCIASHSIVDLPSTRTSPAVGSSKRLMSLSVVVLPDPLRPSKTSVSPRATSKLRSQTRRLSPMLRLTLRNSITVSRVLSDCVVANLTDSQVINRFLYLAVPGALKVTNQNISRARAVAYHRIVKRVEVMRFIRSDGYEPRSRKLDRSFRYRHHGLAFDLSLKAVAR